MTPPVVERMLRARARALTRCWRWAPYTKDVAASNHQLMSAPAPAAVERLRAAARTLSRMAPSMASTIDVVAIGLDPSLLAETAGAVAAEFGLVASVGGDPVDSVRFERDRTRSR